MSWKARIFDRSARLAAPIVALATQKTGLDAPISLKTFLARVPKGKALEIGPFYCPKILGDAVSYFDVLSQEQLRARAVELGLDPTGCPVIDHVSPNGDLATIDDRFEAVFSSHCIEHQPDLVSHLQKAERLLKPGAAYHVVIPDKRYCFDHYFDESELGDIYQAYLERRAHHTAQAIVRHRCDLSHNDPMLHWLGLHGAGADPTTALKDVIAECDRSFAGEYVDVHAWYFTPSSFLTVMQDLASLGLIGLKVEAVHNTNFGAQEFFAVLRKSSEAGYGSVH